MGAKIRFFVIFEKKSNKIIKIFGSFELGQQKLLFGTHTLVNRQV